jgi:hypothetical protein
MMGYAAFYWTASVKLILRDGLHLLTFLDCSGTLLLCFLVQKYVDNYTEGNEKQNNKRAHTNDKSSFIKVDIIGH